MEAECSLDRSERSRTLDHSPVLSKISNIRSQSNMYWTSLPEDCADLGHYCPGPCQYLRWSWSHFLTCCQCPRCRAWRWRRQAGLSASRGTSWLDISALYTAVWRVGDMRECFLFMSQIDCYFWRQHFQYFPKFRYIVQILGLRKLPGPSQNIS